MIRNKIKFLSLGLLELLVFTLLIRSHVYGDSEQDIRKVFQGYRQALLKKDGAEALKYISPATIRFFDEIKLAALNHNREEINKLQYADRMIVLRLRAIIGREKLNEMSAADIFKYGVDQGFIDFDGAKEIELDEIKVSGSLAYATIVASYQSDLKGFKPWLAFIKDNDNWKFEYPLSRGIANEVIRVLARQAGQSENDFIIRRIEEIHHIKIGNDIFIANNYK